MDLRQLRYFIAVAEEGHITRAAERLGMQQPPLSQQIKAIEQKLDVQLFRRKARGVELTEAGRVLLDQARAVLERLDHALLLTQRTARGEQGRLLVGIAPTAPFHPFVPQAIRAFREAYPLVSMTFEECLSRQAIERLHSEQIDVAFLRAPVADPQELAVHTLLEEPMVVALPSSHELAGGSLRGKPLPLRALAGEVFILFGGSAGPGIADASLAACHRAGFNPRLGQQAPRIASTLSLVSVGLGVALVPASIQRVRVDGVAYRRLLPSERPAAVLNLALRRGDPSAVVQNFSDLVRRAARDRRWRREGLD
ncbi:MAG: LysR substrate-binding domain-containing protein [Acetobacteraceae bacterium]|nr:LysR substrate-binding domain-containing protein [Acetobacteraceae bacterium]